MTPAAKTKLKLIRERCDAATPGPWRVRTWGGTNQENPEPPEWTIGGPDGFGIEAHDVYPGDGRDVYFIAHAREDVPFLLALVSQYERQREELRVLCNAADQGAQYSGRLKRKGFVLTNFIRKAMQFDTPAKGER